MVEQGIMFDKDSPGAVKDEINIKADFNMENLQYKFLVGAGGVWSTIQDFSEKKTCIWKPTEEGRYMVMVQAKEINSTKPYDLLSMEKFIVGNEKVKLIQNVTIDNVNVTIGEKINISVESNEKILYRFWIQGKQDWELIRDYNLDNALIYTATKEGKQEILIECKRVDSKEIFDEFTTIRFNVLPHVKIEISDFKCLTDNLLVNEELTFKVEVNLEDKRSLLYKFIKINSEGKTTCLQDYSSRRIVTYQENEAGKYRILCLVRDILSNNEYDDRALMLYEVKPYNKVKIKNFTSHVNSPQVSGSSIFLKADVKGGNELVYRYIINGPIAVDTGYIRRNEYLWETSREGEYDITLLVKDVSFEGEYEAKQNIPFTIDKRAEKPAKIVDVMLDSKKVVLIGQPVNIKVMAEGEINLQYSFVVYKDNKETDRIDYGLSNWANFTPEEKGEYEVEIRVKNKYSTKEYDSHTFVYLTAKEYLPGEIDYILLPHKEIHLVGELIELEAITENTRSVLLRYVTKIDGHLVEDTGFIESKKLKVKPRCAGKYVFEIYAKNVKCEEEFDSKKEISLYVHESKPVTDTKVICENDDIEINKEVTFRAISKGGKDVCYEFYVMEKGNWVKVQEYSKKNYYTFIPFVKGQYRVMAMAKSFHKKVKYEDYGELRFNI